MIHQRTANSILYAAGAVAAFLLSGVTGSIFLSLIIVAVVCAPLLLLIAKIFPAPDWYAHEDEGSDVTKLNLSARSKTGNKK